MSSPPYVDLKGVVSIQKDYLVNLGNTSPSDQSQSIMNDIQTNLNKLYNDYSTSSTDGVITKQNEMNAIVQKENQRLLDKKQSVDIALFGQQRAVELNESNRLKQNSYTNLLIVFIITLALFIAIMIASNYLLFIPSVVFDVLSVIVISAGIYVALFNYLDIQSRNNMDFNKLELAGLDNKVGGKSKDTDNGDLLGGLNGCMGSACCDPLTTVWDQGNGLCKPMTLIQGFTTLSFNYNQGDPTSMTSATAKSTTPYEFDSYVPY